MKQERVDEQARRVYEIYCDVWEKQGYVKSAAFVRAVYARAVVSVLRARTGAIASEFSRFATRTNFPAAIRNAHLQSLRMNMQRLEDRWRRRLEIEAKECEYAEQRLRVSQQTLQRAHVGTTMTPTEVPPEPIRQPLGGEGHQEVRVLESGLNRKNPVEAQKWLNLLSLVPVRCGEERSPRVIPKYPMINYARSPSLWMRPAMCPQVRISRASMQES